MHGIKPKDLEWIGTSRKDMQNMPLPVRRSFGYALYAAQLGVKPPEAKPLKGFGGAGVLEVIEDHKGDTYRAVFMCSMCFRKSQSMALEHRNKNWN